MKPKKTETVQIKDAKAMQKFAADFARQILGEPAGNRAKVIALSGDLGAGKTTFSQGFLKELGVKKRVISPTFLIIRNYSLPTTNYTQAFHIDCYRLRKPQELLSLGFKDVLANPCHIVLIEWPELMKKYLPRNARWIEISHLEKGTSRSIVIS